MKLTDQQRRTIETVVAVYETGRLPSPESYSTTTILADGAGISYGTHQATAASGSLREIVASYYAAGGSLGEWDEIEAQGAILLSVGRSPLEPVPPRVQAAIDRLRCAGSDQRMQAAQDRVFRVRYLEPALAQCDDLGLTCPLSALALYDLAIQSGTGRLAKLRMLFPQVPPVRGGDERGWTAALVYARDQWLAASPTPAVRRTTYRTRSLLRLIEDGHWSLSRPVTVLGIPVR